MKKVLSLDISSSTIGWALIEYNKEEINLLEYGYIKPPKKKRGSLSLRLSKTVDMITELIADTHPDEVAVEDYARKFSKGRSTANTIIILSTFNETVCLTAFRIMSKDVFRYPVATIRSHVGKLFETKIVSKDDVFPEIVKKSKIFKVELNRNNNTKKESGDVADAIACGLTHALKEGCSAKRYSL